MKELSSTERCNHTLLQLLRLLEVNKVGGIGGFDWKGTLRLLKEKGVVLLMDERESIESTMRKISRAVGELKGEGLNRQALKGRVQEVVSNIVKEELGISVTDFYVRKAILIDEAYDDEDIGIFLSQGLQSDVRVLHGFLKNKSARRGINIAPEYFEDYDDFIDPIYLFLLLDFITDGVLDFDFVGECIGADENFLTSDEYQTPELEPVEITEIQETFQDQNTYEPEPDRSNIGRGSTYEPDTTSSNDYDSGGDSGGDSSGDSGDD